MLQVSPVFAVSKDGFGNGQGRSIGIIMASKMVAEDETCFLKWTPFWNYLIENHFVVRKAMMIEVVQGQRDSEQLWVAWERAGEPTQK